MASRLRIEQELERILDNLKSETDDAAEPSEYNVHKREFLLEALLRRLRCCHW